MKKITILLDDNEKLVEFDEMINRSIEFHVEHVPDIGPVKKKIRHVNRGKDGMTISNAIMKHHTPSGMFTKETAEKWIVSEGFSENSTSPGISALKKQGLVEQIGHMKYQFLNKA